MGNDWPAATTVRQDGSLAGGALEPPPLTSARLERRLNARTRMPLQYERTRQQRGLPSGVCMPIASTRRCAAQGRRWEGSYHAPRDVLEPCGVRRSRQCYISDKKYVLERVVIGPPCADGRAEARRLSRDPMP